MQYYQKRITLIQLRSSSSTNVNEKLQWFGTSLGLFNLRDKDKSCFRIFVTLLKAAKTSQSLTSDEIAYKLNLSRGTVIHHINKLIDAGIVISEKNKYMLRVDSLKGLIDEIEKDTKRLLEDLRDVAKGLDGYLQ